jgi:Uma2 family endonuclease
MATMPISDRYVTVEEYLHTVYEPDCEYNDGDLLKRNLGEFDHSYLQVILGTLFTVNMENWGVFGLPEQRVQINPLKFLVPDICVLSLSAPREQIITHPPLIAIEIMSPEDTLRKVAVKATIYLEFGVEHA